MKKKILLVGKRIILEEKIKNKLIKSFSVKHISFSDFKKIGNKSLKSFYLLINCSFNKNINNVKNNPDIYIAKKIKKTTIRYVMLSTSKVYGIDNYKKKIKENFKCKPKTKYGLIRFKTENVLLNLLSKRLLILRISNILIFDLRNDKWSSNFINTMLNSLKYKFTITIPKKKILKDFITIDYFTENLLKLIKKEAIGIFNISSSIGISLKKISFLLINGFGRGNINYINTNSDSFILSNKKLIKVNRKYISLKILNKYIYNLGKKLRNA